MRLRPYQVDAIERSREALRSGSRRVLIVAPTGAGKTVIAAEIIRGAVARGRRVLFVAHRRELIGQAYAKLVGVGFVGVIMANDPRRRPTAMVQVASIDTLRRRAKPLADLVVVDEAHRALARSYAELADAYPRAVHLGLTATPYRADGRGLGAAFDSLVVVSTPRALIDAGYLVEPRVFTVPAADLPDLSNVRIKGNDYDPQALALAVDRVGIVGNIVAHWHRHGGGHRTVAFAASVAHSRHIAASFVAAGVAAEHLDGETPTDERDAILARLERGDTRVVVNCGVLCEGWDQPSVKTCILARPTKSCGLYLQQAGRILRPYESAGATILDHAGCVIEHGLPQDDRVFSLERPKRRRGVATAPPCKTCETCFAIVASSVAVCPACGMAFPARESTALVETDGDLVEVRAATADEKRAAWDALVRTVVERGYQPGWAAHQYRQRFGAWPPSTFARPRVVEDDDGKRTYLRSLRREAAVHGYAQGWIAARFRGRYGHAIPAEWGTHATLRDSESLD